MLKNTLYEFEFADGDKVKMTLAFYALYQIKSINRGLYDRYNKIMTKGATEELDMLTVLYTAYVCANISGEIMTEEEFLIKCGSDRQAIKTAMEQLVTPKKR
jgi:hypothetical protein